MVSILAQCVNSVPSLALGFGYGLALDFGLDLMQPVNSQRQCAPNCGDRMSSLISLQEPSRTGFKYRCTVGTVSATSSGIF